jgi:pimeloyl-ACP methyl ester carboxylesterase
MIKKISLSVLAFLLAIIAITFIFYSIDRSNRLAVLESESQVIETAAGQIEYKLYGDSGPVVLSLHGTPGGYDQIGLFTIPGFRVLAPSRPGYLRTPLSVGKTPSEQANAYIALLDALGFDSVAVMGTSGGGPSAIAFASLFPERTRGLIALSAVSYPIGSIEDNPSRLIPDYFLWLALKLLNTEMIIKFAVPDIGNQPEGIELTQQVAWSMWPLSRRTVGYINDAIQFPTLDLPNTGISSPTLIIHGTVDRIPFTDSEQLKDQIDGAALYKIEGADHFMIVSHKDEIDNIIIEFLNSLERD